MKQFVGIDMGSQKHSVCILDEQSEKIKALEIGNTLEQFRMLEQYLDGKEDVRVCCEGVHGPVAHGPARPTLPA
jgi:hypothetical protein